MNLLSANFVFTVDSKMDLQYYLTKTKPMDSKNCLKIKPEGIKPFVHNIFRRFCYVF